MHGRRADLALFPFGGAESTEFGKIVRIGEDFILILDPSDLLDAGVLEAVEAASETLAGSASASPPSA